MKMIMPELQLCAYCRERARFHTRRWKIIATW